jgi:hypothetical protein
MVKDKGSINVLQWLPANSLGTRVSTREQRRGGCPATLSVPVILVPLPYTPTHTSLKVKFTLEQAMKAQRGSKSIALLFL